MKVHLIQEGIDELLPMPDRSEGLHISTILGAILDGIGYWGNNDGPFGDGSSAFELGCAWEDAVVEALAKRYVKNDPSRYVIPGEMEKDGIYGTPDLLNATEWIVEEIKLAWMSANQDVHGKKFWRYWVQLKAYCHMVETRVGRIHVCHLNGDYKENRGPIYRVWEAEFTMEELTDNWKMLTTQGEEMR